MKKLIILFIAVFSLSFLVACAADRLVGEPAYKPPVVDDCPDGT